MATITVLHQRQPSVQESLSPQQLREWAIWWGSPGGGASHARRRKPLSPQQHREWTVQWGSPGGGAWGATTGGSGGGKQQQQCPPETLSPQRLREWAVRWGSPGGEGFRSTRNWGVEAPGAVEAASLGAFDSPSTGQVAASVEVAASCSYRLLMHQNLLWHHRLGHPSLRRLRGMHSRLLVSGLPRSLPPLPRLLALPCLPCIKGRQRAAPHSSSFPPILAPLQTLHMDVARLREDLTLLRLHSVRGGEFCSHLLEDFCGAEGIIQSSYTLPAPPQQNGIAERCIGLVMEVAPTSIIHAAAPHSLRSFAVRYAAEKLNLWPRVSHPETSPTLRWTGEDGDASALRVWGSLSRVRDLPAGKLSLHTLWCVFLGFPTDVLPWQFYHLGSHCVLSSRDVTFDEYVCFYRLQPHLCSPVPLPPLSLVDDPPPPSSPPPSSRSRSLRFVSAEGGDQIAADTVAPRRFARLAVPPGFPPQPTSLPLWPVAVDSGASGGGDNGGADSGGAGSWGAASPTGEGGAGGAAAGGSAGGGAGGAGAGGAGASGCGGAGLGGPSAGVPGVGRGGGTGAGGTGATGGTRGAAAVGAAAGSPGSGRTGAAGSGGASPGGTSAGVPGVGHAGGTGTGGTGTTGGTGGAGLESLSSQQLRAWAVCSGSPGGGAGGADSGGSFPTGARGSGGVTTQLQQSTLCHLLNLPPASTEFSVAGTTPSLFFPPTDQSQPQLVPGSPLLDPAPHIEVTESLTERCEPETHASTPVRSLRVVHPRAPASGATFALVAELVDLAGLCRLDYAASLVINSPCHLSVGGELALGCDILEDRQFELECQAAAAPHLASTLLCPEGDPDALDIPTPRSYAKAITGPYSSKWQMVMDAKMASCKSTGTYVDEVPSPGANIADGMWIFRVKQPPDSPPAFKARYVARGLSQHEGFDFFHTFFPTPKMTTLRVLLHVAAQRDYELHFFDFSTAFLQGSLHEAIWLRYTYVLVYIDDLVFATTDTEALALVNAKLQERHTCTDLGELRSYLSLQITRDRARHTITLTQSQMVQQVLQHVDFTWSSP
ncbi:unnamed protein product [Closterium sp. NIES-53]